jgi:hypothetical protein
MLRLTNRRHRETTVEVLTVIAAAPAFAGEEASVVTQGVRDACRGGGTTVSSG